MKYLISLELLASTAVLALAVGAASAQSLSEEEPSTAGASITEQAAALGSLSENDSVQTNDIVVTGSRIRRQDFSSPTPIVTLGSALLQKSSAGTVSDALNQLPQISPSNNAATSAAGRSAQAGVNLRGLGSNRALILLDGLRVQPSTAEGVVDVNFLPSLLVSQVETITGGASSTYGSDAVTGVVNFILRRDVQGLELRGQYNLPEFGSGASSTLGALWGSRFADDRMSMTFALDYTERQRSIRGERGFWRVSSTSAILERPVLNFASNAPSQAAINAIFGSYGAEFGSVIPTSRIGVNDDLTLFTQAPVTSPVVNYRGPLDDETLLLNNSIIRNNGFVYDVTTPFRRVSAFGRVDFEVSDSLRLFAQGLYTRNRVSSQITATGLGTAGVNGSLPVSNPFIPASVRTLLASRANPNAAVPITYMFDQIGPSINDYKFDIFQAVLGAKGDVGRWTWEVYGTYGKTTQRLIQRNGQSLSRIQSLLNATDGGASLCGGGLNLFGPASAISNSCLQYIGLTATSHDRLKQAVAEANFEGPLFKLPAGEVRAATGISFRDGKYATRPDPVLGTGDFLGSTGLAFDAGGSQNVWEIYGEILAPLIKEIPVIKELTLGLGYRYSRYSLSGKAHTYRADLEWTVFEPLKLRGGYARAIRAPSLAELFSATSGLSASIGTPTSGGFAGDPCDIRSSFRRGANADRVRALCIAQGVPAASVDTYTFPTATIFASTGGNQALEPERADTLTVGAVLRSPVQSPVLSNFAVSIDYYNIKVNKAIGQLPIATTLARCFNADGSNPNYDASDFYCQFIGRNNVGSIAANTRVPTLNLGSYHTSGIDGQIDWTIPMSVLGAKGNDNLRLNMVGTYVKDFKIQALPGAAVANFSGHSQGAITSSVLPKWKSVANADYSASGGGFGLRWRHIGSVKDVSLVTSPTSVIPGVNAQDYFDVNFHVDVADSFSFYGGVNNVADRAPPQVGSSIGFATDAATYDVLGRVLYIGAKAKF